MPRLHWLAFVVVLLLVMAPPEVSLGSLPADGKVATRTRKPQHDIESVSEQLRQIGHATFGSLEIRVARIEGRRLILPIFQQVTKDGQKGPVWRAKQAKFTLSRNKRVLLLWMKEGHYTGTGIEAWFDDRIFELPYRPIEDIFP